MRALEFTHRAEADIAAILGHSSERFGARARSRYEALLELALSEIRTDPQRSGSVGRSELGADIRTFHLRHCRVRTGAKAARVGRPRHLLAYVFDDERVLVLRVLHDAMELSRHMPRDPA